MLFALTALTFPTALRRTVMPLSALANCLAGFLAVWLFYDVTLDGELSQTRAGVMTAAVIVVMFFGFGIFRIPPGAALVAVTPYAAFGTYQLYESYDHAELTGVEASSLGAGLWIAYLGGLMVCIVIEIVERRAFCKDQIIDAQQRELRNTREAIRRYVPRAVYEHIAAATSSASTCRRAGRVTVMVADLVGFTVMADRVDPEVLTQVVNEYMTAMSQIVDEHGGFVSEFAGDGPVASSALLTTWRSRTRRWARSGQPRRCSPGSRR